MILALLLMFHVQAEEPKAPESVEAACAPQEKFQFGNVELKLNLDGNKPDDAVVRMIATEDERHFYRRGLILNPPKKIENPTIDQWLEECQEGGEQPSITTITYDKVKAGNREILIRKTEGGTAGTYEYLTVQEGLLKSEFKYSNPSLNGHFNETRKKGLSIRIVGDGELTVAGETIDLDAKSIKARCRVRELYIQLKYDWDAKASRFKEVDQGCVIDSAID